MHAYFFSAIYSANSAIWGHGQIFCNLQIAEFFNYVGGGGARPGRAEKILVFGVKIRLEIIQFDEIIFKYFFVTRRE